MSKRLRVAVLLSGTGRTLENLLRERDAGRLEADVVAVASNKGRVRGLEIARAAGVPARSFRLSDHADRRTRDAAMLGWLHEHDPDLLALAGYLSLLDLGATHGLPVLNIHPALLPRHGGAGCFGHRVHEAVIAAGDCESGCTVHLVDAAYDRGRILAQRRVEVRPEDDADQLARRVFEAECVLYPEVLNRIARGDLAIGPERA